MFTACSVRIASSMHMHAFPSCIQHSWLTAKPHDLVCIVSTRRPIRNDCTAQAGISSSGHTAGYYVQWLHDCMFTACSVCIASSMHMHAFPSCIQHSWLTAKPHDLVCIVSTRRPIRNDCTAQAGISSSGHTARYYVQWLHDCMFTVCSVCIARSMHTHAFTSCLQHRQHTARLYKLVHIVSRLTKALHALRKNLALQHDCVWPSMCAWQ